MRDLPYAFISASAPSTVPNSTNAKPRFLPVALSPFWLKTCQIELHFCMRWLTNLKTLSAISRTCWGQKEAKCCSIFQDQFCQQIRIICWKKKSSERLDQYALCTDKIKPNHCFRRALRKSSDHYCLTRRALLRPCKKLLRTW